MNAMPVLNSVYSVSSGIISSHSQRGKWPKSARMGTNTTSVMHRLRKRWTTVARGRVMRGKFSDCTRLRLPEIDFDPSLKQPVKNSKMKTPTTT